MACTRPLNAYRLRDGSISFNYNTALRDCFVPSERNVKDIFLPCGKCSRCRLEYSKQWALRCIHEAEGKPSCFISLTYRNDPKVLIKEDLQKFIKALRDKINKPIKYFACGEYGDKKSRPHFHLAVFGYNFPDLYAPQNLNFKKNQSWIVSRSDILEGIWNKGFSTVGSVNFQSSAYIARYIMKKRKGKDSEEYYRQHELTPEFTLMSKGNRLNPNNAIGYDYYKKWAYKYQIGFDKPRDSMTFKSYKGNVVKCKQPRYYDKLLERWDVDTFNRLKNIREKYVKDPDYERLIASEHLESKKLGKLIRQLHIDS